MHNVIIKNNNNNYYYYIFFIVIIVFHHANYLSTLSDPFSPDIHVNPTSLSHLLHIFLFFLINPKTTTSPSVDPASTSPLYCLSAARLCAAGGCSAAVAGKRGF